MLSPLASFEVAFGGEFPAQIRFRPHPHFTVPAAASITGKLSFGPMSLSDVLMVLKELCLAASDERRARPLPAAAVVDLGWAAAERPEYEEKFAIEQEAVWKEGFADPVLRAKMAKAGGTISEFAPPSLLRTGFDLIDALHETRDKNPGVSENRVPIIYHENPTTPSSSSASSLRSHRLH